MLFQYPKSLHRAGIKISLYTYKTTHLSRSKHNATHFSSKPRTPSAASEANSIKETAWRLTPKLQGSIQAIPFHSANTVTVAKSNRTFLMIPFARVNTTGPHHWFHPKTACPGSIYTEIYILHTPQECSVHNDVCGVTANRALLKSDGCCNGR